MMGANAQGRTVSGWLGWLWVVMGSILVLNFSGCDPGPVDGTGDELLDDEQISSQSYALGCGDYVCQATETCTSCPNDCGACTAVTTTPDVNWFDVVVKTYKLSGGASGYQLVAEVDHTQVYKAKVDNNTPFWFRYYKAMWNSSNQFMNSGKLWEWALSTDCVGLEWYGIARKSYTWNGDTKYSTRGCASSWGKGTNKVCSKAVVHHYQDNILNWYPGVSSLGWNYYDPNVPYSARTLNFKLHLNKWVTVSAETFSCYANWYIRSVVAGEVTSDGYAVVPQDSEPRNEPLTPFFQWIFVVPKGVTPTVSTCEPCVMGCGAPCYDGGPIQIYDPPLWTASDEELLRRALEEGVGLGGGDIVTSTDISKEGWYIITKDATGKWVVGKKVSRNEAWDKLKSIRHLAVNGAAKTFQTAMNDATLMAQEMGLTSTVVYYLPQAFGPIKFLNATNTTARNELAAIYNLANSQAVTINVSAHSWGAYVAATTCRTNSCNTSKINLLAYGMATVAEKWPQLKDAKNTWQGTMRPIVGSWDLVLAVNTNYNTPTTNTTKVIQTNVSARHGLSNILTAKDYKPYWK